MYCGACAVAGAKGAGGTERLRASSANDGKTRAVVSQRTLPDVPADFGDDREPFVIRLYCTLAFPVDSRRTNSGSMTISWSAALPPDFARRDSQASLPMRSRGMWTV